eukprot:NODE_1241_length_1014_cov_793.400000_g776_i1.p1 GENE.NODE_1241_length_1014_cov_793.400000_g776_i1~~NODE_1241_length_1014_cov_793.400000_g776_i1.p1  ORF type:complete len:245 (-),score=63.99 NODE_1241_length_1014_cov_793.400000_g776_i1:278-955(-)
MPELAVNTLVAKELSSSSSPYHKQTTEVKTPEESKAVYAKWAKFYDAEVQSNGFYAPSSLCEMAKRIIDPNGSLKILDAGCGTGLLGQEFKKSVQPGAQMSGVDISPEMVEEARQKKCFDGDLKVGNLKEELPFEKNSFDLVICVGCFLPGHCGPECIGTMFATLKVGGYGMFSIRQGYFTSLEQEFLEAIEAADCVVTDREVMPYYKDILGMFFTVRKVEPAQS